MTFEEIMKNPAAAFNHPADIINASELDREQKIRVLRQWEYDARELEVAEEENMGGGPPDLLGAIVTALGELGANDDNIPPTKHGGE